VLGFNFLYIYNFFKGLPALGKQGKESRSYKSQGGIQERNLLSPRDYLGGRARRRNEKRWK